MSLTALMSGASIVFAKHSLIAEMSSVDTRSEAFIEEYAHSLAAALKDLITDHQTTPKIDDIICRANDSEYGLGGTVWTGDWERGIAVARRIDTGTVWVNGHMAINPLIATGGAKQSGIGRELGVEGLKEFTQAKVISVRK